MKTILILIAALFLIADPIFGHTTNKKIAYHEARYKSYTCGNKKLTIDMANVSMVKFDAMYTAAW